MPGTPRIGLPVILFLSNNVATVLLERRDIPFASCGISSTLSWANLLVCAAAEHIPLAAGGHLPAFRMPRRLTTPWPLAFVYSCNKRAVAVTLPFACSPYLISYYDRCWHCRLPTLTCSPPTRRAVRYPMTLPATAYCAYHRLYLIFSLSRAPLTLLQRSRLALPPASCLR